MSTRIVKPQPRMRKEPRQGRSKATVEAILQAGAHILSESGWAGFTTNSVAEKAGASIGSLYQYFPNKLSLIEAIRRRHLDDCLAVMRRSRTVQKPLEQFVADLVEDMIAVHNIHPGLHRVLLDEVPVPTDSKSPVASYELEYLGYYEAAVAVYQHQRPNAERGMIALVLSDTVDGVIHNAARRGMLASPVLKQELRRILYFYLRDTVTVATLAATSVRDSTSSP